MTKSRTTFLAISFVLGSFAYIAATATSFAGALGAINKPVLAETSQATPSIKLVRSRDDLFGRKQSRRQHVRREDRKSVV